jgi:hypothetical protein
MNTEQKSRRNFVRGAAAAAALGAVPLEPFLGGKESQAEASVIGYNRANRTAASFNSRLDAALAQRIDNWSPARQRRLGPVRGPQRRMAQGDPARRP